METNNLFQSYGNGNQTQNNNPNWYRYSDMNINQPSPYGNMGFINRTSTSTPSLSNIPVRVVFSPEQIAPQEIPTNGTPALFPLSDGSCIIARSLLGNGRFDERVYVLQPRNQQNNDQNQVSEFEQVMKRLENIESSLNQVLNDLYGSKSQPNQEGVVTSNE